jgi:hypothetical protein
MDDNAFHVVPRRDERGAGPVEDPSVDLDRPQPVLGIPRLDHCGVLGERRIRLFQSYPAD